MQFDDVTMVSVDQSHFGTTENPLDDPHEIGCFSIDADKHLHYDRSQMRYYIRRIGRNLHLDLNFGYERDIRKCFVREEKMNNLLRWIAHWEFEPLKQHSTKFVCTRSAIEAPLNTPFFCPGRFEHWIICASRLDDVIYLKLVETDSKIEREEEATEEMKRLSAWGFKFEQYMISDRPYGVPDITSTTHQTEEFFNVVTNRIGNHSLMIEAEIDAVSPLSPVRPGTGDTSCYVELKTSKLVPNFRSSYQFKKFKSLKWWSQSTAVGVKEIICGLRDENGFVESIETFNTAELPSLCDNKWCSRISFNFCNNFLNHVSKKLSRNDPNLIYKYEYYGGSHVREFRLRNAADRFQVIPDWYITEMQKKTKLH